jgi:hypothetical protein
MKNYYLNSVDSEDIDDLLIKVEKSFHIKFTNGELARITTFGELCDHIIKKVELNTVDDCTSQQAFYKLRQSFINIDSRYCDITPDSLLIDLLPKQRRISIIKEIEKNLGFKLSILRPPHSISIIFTGILITSLVLLFSSWKVGLLMLTFSLLGIWVANKLGNELSVVTVGELVIKMTRENYLNSRKNSDTINKSEIEKLLTKWFVEDFDLEPSSLTRESKIA